MTSLRFPWDLRPKRARCAAPFLLLCLASAGVAPAITITVPGDAPTIADALDRAEPFDVIEVAEGLYELDAGLVVLTPDLTVRSESPQAAVLVLPSYPERLFDIRADRFRIEGFGAYCSNGIHIASGVEGTVVRDNQIYNVLSFGAGVGDSGRGSRFEANRIQGFFYAGWLGEGAWFEDNLVTFNGGPLFLEDGVTVRRNVFEANSAYSDNGGGGWGAALRIDDDVDVRIHENEFINNITDAWDAEEPGLGGAIYLGPGGAAEVVGNRFTRNQARSGAALHAERATLILKDNVFHANSDSVRFGENPERGRGGALRLIDVTGRIENNTFHGNRAELGGAAISFAGPAVPEFRANLVTRNWSLGPAVEAEDTAPSVWSCSDVYGNDVSAAFGGWPDPTGSDGNLSVDPLFCDPEAEDFTLAGGSPCLPGVSPPGCGLIGALGIGCPVTGVAEPGSEAADDVGPGPGGERLAVRRASIEAFPNPTTAPVRIRFTWEAEASDRRTAPAGLRVVTVGVRTVRELSVPQMTAAGDGTVGAHAFSAIEWDLRDSSGQRVRPGLYFLSVDGFAGAGRVLVLD